MEMMNACLCCMLRPPDKDLSTPYPRAGSTEIYSDMLEYCFQIQLTAGGICEDCVEQLRDARDFRLQVECSQARLQSQLRPWPPLEDESAGCLLETCDESVSCLPGTCSDKTGDEFTNCIPIRRDVASEKSQLNESPPIVIEIDSDTDDESCMLYEEPPVKVEMETDSGDELEETLQTARRDLLAPQGAHRLQETQENAQYTYQGHDEALQGSQGPTEPRGARGPERSRGSSATSDNSMSTQAWPPISYNDMEYREKRNRNNEAARRCRIIRKLRELHIEQKANELEKKNRKLRTQAAILEEKTEWLKNAICGMHTPASDAAGPVSLKSEEAGPVSLKSEGAGPVNPASDTAGPASPMSEGARPASPMSEEADLASPTSEGASPASPTGEEADLASPTSEEAGPASPTSGEPGPPSPTSEEAGPASPTSDTAGPASPTSDTAGPASPTSEEAGPMSPTSEEAGPMSPTSEEAGPASPASDTSGSARALARRQLAMSCYVQLERLRDSPATPTAAPDPAAEPCAPTRLPSDQQDRPYFCFFCKKHFTEISDLVAHMEIHTGQKPYSCQICHKMFPNKSHLMLHSKIHNRYTADQYNIMKNRTDLVRTVDKLFSRKSVHLIEHQRVEEKPYRCEVCNKLFTLSSSLLKHMRIHMAIEPHARTIRRSMPKTYTCEGFNTMLAQSDVTKQIKRRYCCHKCKINFIRKREFDKHKHTHSNVKNKLVIGI